MLKENKMKTERSILKNTVFLTVGKGLGDLCTLFLLDFLEKIFQRKRNQIQTIQGTEIMGFKVDFRGIGAAKAGTT